MVGTTAIRPQTLNELGAAIHRLGFFSPLSARLATRGDLRNHGSSGLIGTPQEALAAAVAVR